MRAVDIIEKKADGLELSEEEIHFIVDGFVKAEVPDYQMSAFMMAVRNRGMTPRETAALTFIMMNSGDVADLSDLKGVKLDKHSTGGVGDTTTLVVAPLVAACGGVVAKMSGRGLGHTGGTLDKLEAIPGTSVEQSMEDFKRIVRENGVAVIGQTSNLVPADKLMYALRDVSATVRSIPLIASSIMSKKLASGSDAIVLDVKTGGGAFMRKTEEAAELAKMMVRIGGIMNRKVRAVITDMNQPLGMAVGNALEVKEAIELLSGKIAPSDPLYEVCMLLGMHMLMMGNLAENETDARSSLKAAIDSGEGLRRLRRMIELQGGDGSYISLDKIDELLNVKKKIDLRAEKAGYVSEMYAEMIGNAAQMLGAGRSVKEDVIDPAVGLLMKVRCGDKIAMGDPICTLYVNDEKNLEQVKRMMHDAVVISDYPTERKQMVYGVITEENI